MPTTVVFYGNCQAHALSRLYQRQIAPRRNETVSLIYVGNEAAEVLLQADVVIEQTFTAREQIRASDVRPGAKWLRFPLVYGMFLWPYATQAHVRNESHPFLPGGPFPVEYGDSYLNRLIDHVPPEEAIAKYMDLDVPAHAHLDRLYEIAMEDQRQRDRVAGMDIATIVERDFRSTPLFMTRGHPTRRLFDHVATTLFSNMGIPEDEIRLAISSYFRSMLPWGELPVHPSVIAHYGLEYVTKDSEYRFFQEGKLTFKEYVSRYVRYDWNRELHQGIYLARSPDASPEEALRLLEKGLEKAPQSDLGLRAKSDALVRSGNLESARDAAAAAVAADPEHTENHVVLASVLMRMGDLAAAEATLRQALEMQPHGAKLHRTLADVLSRAGRSQAAVDVAEIAVSLSPGDAHVYGLLGLTMHRNSDLDGAEKAYRRALELAPEVPNFQSGLQLVLAQKEKAK
jgi:Flp pilus assembly protein TadD